MQRKALPKSARAFELLGVNIRDAEGNVRNAGDLMPEIADALDKIESPAERAAISVDLFGRAGQKLEALLEGGAKGLRKYAADAHALGTVLSSEEIAAADKVADDLARLNFQVEAQQNRKLLENADAILAFEKSLSDLKLGLIGANNQMQSWVDQFDAFNARNAETTRAFYSRIGEFAASIPERIDVMVVETRAAISRFVAQMIEMGRNMIDGLVRGIAERAGRVRDAVNGAVSDAVNSARNFLGIRSPSRLFMELGGYMAEGMAIGIEGGTPRVQSAMAGLLGNAGITPAAPANDTGSADAGQAGDTFGAMIGLSKQWQDVIQSVGNTFGGVAQSIAQMIGSAINPALDSSLSTPAFSRWPKVWRA